MNLKSFFHSNLFSVILIISLGSYFLLYNLDGSTLWQDEAETACVGRTIVNGSPIPKGYNGLNSFSQQRGQELGENYVWKLHPWFQFYWVAGSFSFFEETTYYARLPFALLGLATLVMVYYLCLLIWEDKKTAWYTVVFFLISVTFLLLSRQARYYAPAMFFSIYASYAFFSFLKKKKFALIHFCIATTLLFHSQYLFAMVFWGVSLFYTYLFHKPYLKKLAITILCLAIPNLIFLYWLLDTPYGTGFIIGNSLWEGLQTYPQFIFDYLMSPIWLLVPVGFYFLLKEKVQWNMEEKVLLFFFLLILVNLIGLLMLGRLVFARYLCGLVPFIFLLKGRFSFWLSKIHLGIPLLAIAATISFSDFPRFIKELPKPEVGPIGGLVQFLESESTPNNRIAITYGDLPLKFYLPNNPIYGGLADDLPSNLDSIDFIIVRHFNLTDRDKEVSSILATYLQKNPKLFSAYGIKVKDQPYECRETPMEHYRNKDLKASNLRVYKRISK